MYLYALVDRHLLILLVEPMRADLGINDTQFSIAYTFGFAVTLGLASVPAGRLVDRGSRVRVLAAAVALWSIMTMATGFATGFLMLLACRIGVAFGQAAVNPASYALIADRFPPASLGLALGIFGVAPHIGIGVANLVGAAVLATLPIDGMTLPLLGLLRPWQLVLVFAGAPGIVVALLLARLADRPTDDQTEPVHPPIAAVVRFFRTNLASFGLLKLATGFAVMAVYAITGWSATLLVRIHGWTAIEAGVVLGPTFLLAGAGGALSGGALGD